MAQGDFELGVPASGMRRRAMPFAAAAIAALLAASSPSTAQTLAETDGAGLYLQHCASCHGSAGRGDGPIADKLKVPPPALTTLARRHGGTFPTDYVYQIIDGREQRLAHGGRDMPVWGSYYGMQARWRDRDAPDTETVIQQRILALIDHLKTFQVAYTAGAGAGAAAATEDVLNRYLAAFKARDIDAVMAAYDDGAVLVLPTGELQGKAQIGTYYSALFGEFGKAGSAFQLDERSVVENVARIAWSGETADTVFELTTETLAVEDGKIRYQIVAFKTKTR